MKPCGASPCDASTAALLLKDEIAVMWEAHRALPVLHWPMATQGQHALQHYCTAAIMARGVGSNPRTHLPHCSMGHINLLLLHFLNHFFLHWGLQCRQNKQGWDMYFTKNFSRPGSAVPVKAEKKGVSRQDKKCDFSGLKLLPFFLLVFCQLSSQLAL